MEPREFYRDMPSTGGFENPLGFLAISGAFYFILKVVVSGLPNTVNAFFLVCLVVIFGPGILMLACRYLFEGVGDYQGTLRLCAYAGVTLTRAWIPSLARKRFIC